MPKSKTQAEKQAARDASNEAKAAARATEKAQRDALLRAQALEGEQMKKQAKDKKLQEKQNKEKHKQKEKEKEKEKEKQEQENDGIIPFTLSLDSESSHVPGLSAFLIKLHKLLPVCAISCDDPQTCDTQNDDEKFQFEHEPPSGNTVTHQGYRYVATCGTQMQVVTLTPRSIGGVVMSRDMIQSHINTLLHSVNEHDDDGHDTSDHSSYINPNHLVVAEQTLALKEQQSKQHQHQQQQQQTRLHQQKITEIKKTLLTKKLSREDVDELAQRDLDIKSGKDRGKYAMKK